MTPRKLLLVISALASAACSDVDGGGAPASAGDGTEPVPDTATTESDLGEAVADLRADTNRDGVVTFDDASDDQGEDTWNASRGAVFLANIDDDQERCPTDVDDVDLPKCHDAADEIVNGPEDAKDLARLATKPWAQAPAGAKGTISFTAASHVRLFQVKGAQFVPLTSGHTLTREELATGVELAIEGKDIVRDRAVWDGFVDVTFVVTSVSSSGTPTTATDKVRMRVAPVVTFHHGLEPVQTFVSSYGSQGNRAMRTDLAAAASAAGVAAPTPIGVDDPWTQDFFETGYMSMPAAAGKQHVIRVTYRSANVEAPYDARNPLRQSGRVAFLLRGKDSAAVQQYDRAHPPQTDTLNSFGNFETIPPYSVAGQSYPLGRVIRGSSPSYRVDGPFQKMIEAQGVQPPIYVDTSWLLVAHIDETVSFVKAPSARGWVMLVNDPTLAVSILRAQDAAGRGGTSMFVGKYWDGASPAQTTIAQVLSDPDIMASSAEAAVEVSAQVAKIRAETGLTEAEIVKIPFLHMPVDGRSVAYQPATVNGLSLTTKDFVAPKAHGPVVGGRDLFEKAVTDALAPLGVTAHFAEDWDDYHRNLGEVHCGTNAARAIPQIKWWETGR